MTKINSQIERSPIKEKLGLLTRKEAAKELGVSLTTLHRYNKSGVLRARFIGGIVRYTLDDIRKCLEIEPA